MTSAMNMKPIYIAGPNRSGTSLMYALLASHPEISMVQRTDMWRYFYQQYGDLSQADNFEQCLRAMLKYRRITRLNPEAERIRREFWAGEPSYGRLFALFHEHHAERTGKRRWGDKSLHTEHHVDQIMAEFPKAKVILVTRDPRDRYASERKRFRSTPGSATGKWLASIRATKRSKARYPEATMIVRYETLASQPEQTLRDVCSFLDEEYDPVMLSMKGAPEHLEQGGDSSFEQFAPGEISTRSIGRFARVLSPGEIHFIQLFAGRQMRSLDYRMHPVRFTWKERSKFYLRTLPINLARLMRGRASIAYKNRTGRSIRAHRVVDPHTSKATSGA